jgi:rare lipoprotein A
MHREATPRRTSRRWLAGTVMLTAAGIAAGTASAQQPSAPAPPPASAPAPGAPGGGLTGTVGETQSGLAGYYSDRLKGHRTASGERYDPDALTTAHQTLPFGTKVKITNQANHKSAVLRVNDRGPTQASRIVDVSRRAGRELGLLKSGLSEVKLEVVETAKPRAGKKPAEKK